jgi:hypothetical protein
MSLTKLSGNNVMTRQEVFNKVARHLLQQNERSRENGKGCLYRGPRGLKCAVGCLIPDDKYIPVIEGEPVQSIMSRYDILSDFPKEYGLLLANLQNLHDMDEPANWKKGLVEIGKYHDLDTSWLTQ